MIFSENRYPLFGIMLYSVCFFSCDTCCFFFGGTAGAGAERTSDQGSLAICLSGIFLVAD